MRPVLVIVRRWFAALACACLLAVLFPSAARAFDRFTVTYGLREYMEYTDNLFSAREGEEKINDLSLNTAPDLSFVYDDGETRLLARGSFRRESFFDNRDASGNYVAFGGEFSRALNDRVTFSVLGSYTNFASIVLGDVLQEPGQRNVLRPVRGETTQGTVFSPSLTVFWSRRFGTSLTYNDNQSFTEGGLGSIERSITLNGFYGLSRRTVLSGVLVGVANRNSGFALVDKADVNSFVARFGFSHVFSPRLTVDLSAGPQWTKDVNLPRNVTLLRNGIVETVVDPVLGTTAPMFVREPGRRVDDLSLGVSFNLAIAFQLDRRTNLSLFAAKGSTSAAGAAGTNETEELSLTLNRALSSKWGLSMRAGWLKQTGAEKDFEILFTSRDPLTGELLALDRKTFDINARLEQTQLTFEPRLSYRFTPWLDGYVSWNWTELKNDRLGDSTRVNRVQVGLEFRKDAYY